MWWLRLRSWNARLRHRVVRVRRGAPVRFVPELTALEERQTPSYAGLTAVAADAGGGPRVQVFNTVTGAKVADFMAYDPSFAGGVRVAVGDVNGDGLPDLITGAGPGGGPHVKVFAGTGTAGNAATFGINPADVLASFYAYDPHFQGGVFVAAGDVNGATTGGHRIDDIITGADAGGGPEVRVFLGARDAGTLTGNTAHAAAAFYAYDAGFGGGVRVAAADVNGDGAADIITGPGAGGAPVVKVFAGSTGGPLPNLGVPFASFDAYDPAFTGGVYVAGTANFTQAPGQPALPQGAIVTGAGAGGGPEVKVFQYYPAGPLVRTVAPGPPPHFATVMDFMAFDPSFTGGVRVGAAGAGAGAYVTVAAGPAGPPSSAGGAHGTPLPLKTPAATVPQWQGIAGTPAPDVPLPQPLDPAFHGGLFVSQ